MIEIRSTLETLREWLKNPSFPTSGRIFDGTSLYREKEEQQLKLLYRKQISSTHGLILKDQIIQKPKRKKEVKKDIRLSNIWNLVFKNYQLKKKTVSI